MTLCFILYYCQVCNDVTFHPLLLIGRLYEGAFQILFAGGTNFGFMNGANTYSKGYGYNPTVSSYGNTRVFFIRKKFIRKRGSNRQNLKKIVRKSRGSISKIIFFIGQKAVFRLLNYVFTCFLKIRMTTKRDHICLILIILTADPVFRCHGDDYSITKLKRCNTLTAWLKRMTRV